MHEARKKIQADLFEAARLKIKTLEAPRVFNFEDLFGHVLAAATKQAQDHSQLFDCSYDQCLAVNKFLLLDPDWARSMLHNVEPASLRGQFKRDAFLLHPDKNQHPGAKEAFQRAHSLLE